jgi:ABC-type antimicrobial peptide transport system permease subunit
MRISYVLTAIALLLSLAGIYSALSFTVARRTREIGVRVALGASPMKVVTAIFRRPLTQVVIGIVIGTALIAAGGTIEVGDVLGNWMSVRGLVLLIPYMLLMFGICLLACIVPTRRALAVQPSIALRAE